MEIQVKHQIKEKLAGYISQKGSQNKAANSLNDVTAGTLSQIMNEKWELISEAMWRNIAAQIGHTAKEWVCVETADYTLIKQLLNDAQSHSNVFAFTGEAGTGKSKTFELYVAENKNAFLLSCSEFWNRKEFLVNLLSTMGVDYSGFTVAEMMNETVKKLKSMEMPLIIMDEADKLTDQVMYFFITLYNLLEDHCGIVMCATDHLSKRINKGIKLNRKGYKEIYSRIGRKFIVLNGVSFTDVTAICMANGIDKDLQLDVQTPGNTVKRKATKVIFDDCEGDLRRVKRKIHAIKKQVYGA